jgi:hypothetical protein
MDNQRIPRRYQAKLSESERNQAMSLLILGLIVFLGAHSLRIFADSWRGAQIARIGEGPWKVLYSLV